MTASEAESIALRILDVLVAEPERLGRFLALTGLDPSTIREAAAGPDFLPAILDHVAADESLLLAVAAGTGLPPPAIVEAQRRLSPAADWSP